MPTDIQYLCGQPAAPYTDGQKYQPRLGRMGDTIVSELRGKYGEANSRGLLFHYTSAAVNAATGVTIPLFTSTTQTFGIRNPPGSGVVLELVRLDIGYLSGADVPGSLVLSVPPVNAGITATGTGGVTVSTLTSAQSGQLAGGSGPVSRCKIMTGITTAAPTAVLRTLGFSVETALATSTNAGLFQSFYFEGTDLLYPGADLFLGATASAAIGVCIISLTGIEVAYPPGT